MSVNAVYTECVSDMFHICRDYSNVCSKPSTHKTKLKENKMDKLNQGKKAVFITQAAVIAALYTVLVLSLIHI